MSSLINLDIGFHSHNWSRFIQHIPSPSVKISRPIIPAILDWPSVLEVWTGSSVQNIDFLHKKYGSVVRTAPDALSFSTAKAWKGDRTLMFLLLHLINTSRHLRISEGEKSNSKRFQTFSPCRRCSSNSVYVISGPSWEVFSRRLC